MTEVVSISQKWKHYVNGFGISLYVDSLHVNDNTKCTNIYKKISSNHRWCFLFLFQQSALLINNLELHCCHNVWSCNTAIGNFFCTGKLLEAAKYLEDSRILTHFQNTDNDAAEVYYHHSCRNKYVNAFERKRAADTQPRWDRYGLLRILRLITSSKLNDEHWTTQQSTHGKY